MNVAVGRTTMTDKTVSFSPGSVTRVLIFIATALTIASVAGQAAKLGWGIQRAGGLIPGFNLDGEANFPTWYQSASLGVCAGLLALVATATKRTKKRGAGLWRLLALIFLGFSIDELTSVHEMLSRPLRSSLHLSNWLYQGWVIPGALFVIFMVVSYWRFLTELPPKIRRLCIIAGGLYVGGALGMEIVGGHYVVRYGVEHMNWVLCTTVEEGMEMAGVIVFIHALLTYLGQLSVSLHVKNPSVRDPG